MRARQRQDPDAAGTFRLHLARQRLRQAAESRIRQHLADDMARRDRARPGRVHAGARLGDEIETGQRADIVRHMRGDHRL